MTQSTDTPERTPTPEQRITYALGRMPYLPMSEFYSTSSDPEVLARTLESFADALRFIADDNQREHDELVALRNDVAAMRRLMGVPVES